MLAFLDESGDTGRKTTGGSSSYFVVSLVLFLDDEEALACDQRIELLRTELNLPHNYEFHFANNSIRVRETFLKAITPYNFSVITVAVNKDKNRLFGEDFNIKSSFYKYAFVKLEQLAITTNLNHFALKAKLYLKAQQACLSELQALKAGQGFA